MRSASLDAAEYRNGDWGPSYLMQAESLALGVVRLRPGDAIDNHVHHTCDESFVVLEGEGTLWVEAKDSYTLRVGDVYSCEPGEMHYFVNEGDVPFRFVFLKTPASPGDTVVLPWTPGQPAPDVPPVG